MINALSNAAPSTKWELLEHYGKTYFSLRLVLMTLAFAFPVLLYGIGKLRELDLQPSMSAYFFAATAEHCATFPMRTIFVGCLFAIGAGLYCYKGFTKLENVLLNLAGVCAALVALVPERISREDVAQSERLQALFQACPAVKSHIEASWQQPQGLIGTHYAAAVLLFVFLAVVAWLSAAKTLEHLPATANKRHFELAYKGLAIAMVLCPAIGLLVAYVFRGGLESKVFFIEAAGIWIFALYWATKSYELSLSGLEKGGGAGQTAAEREAAAGVLAMKSA